MLRMLEDSMRLGVDILRLQVAMLRMRGMRMRVAVALLTERFYDHSILLPLFDICGANEKVFTLCVLHSCLLQSKTD